MDTTSLRGAHGFTTSLSSDDFLRTTSATAAPLQVAGKKLARTRNDPQNGTRFPVTESLSPHLRPPAGHFSRGLRSCLAPRKVPPGALAPSPFRPHALAFPSAPSRRALGLPDGFRAKTTDFCSFVSAPCPYVLSSNKFTIPPRNTRFFRRKGYPQTNFHPYRYAHTKCNTPPPLNSLV